MEKQGPPSYGSIVNNGNGNGNGDGDGLDGNIVSTSASADASASGVLHHDPVEKAKKEKTLLWKLDWRLLPFLSFLYFLSYLDRSNIANVHDPLLDDLNLTEQQYSMAVGVFYIGYILCEIPANLILKKTNPAYWIGSLVIAWGMCSVGMAFANDFASLLIIRSFLGVSESGFFPGVVYYLSRWYKPEEQSFRLALFYCSSAMAGTIGGLLASGFLKIDESLGLKGWQWLFIIEGAPSILFGALAWFILPSSPEKISWLSDEERSLSSSRLYHIDEAEDSKKIKSAEVFKVLTSPIPWGFSFLFLAIAIPGQAKSFYSPAIISEMGYSTTESNLLSALLSFATFLYIIFNGWHSDRQKERPLHVIIPIFIALLGFLGMSAGSYYDSPQATYAAMFLGAAQGCCLPVILSWLGLSLKGSTSSATATALLISIGNIGGILGPNMYGFLYVEPEEGEEEGSYLYAHLSMVGILFVGLVLAIVMAWVAPAKTKFQKLEEDASSEDIRVHKESKPTDPLIN